MPNVITREPERCSKIHLKEVGSVEAVLEAWKTGFKAARELLISRGQFIFPLSIDMDIADFITDAYKAFCFALLPVLDLIFEATGWVATLTTGVPLEGT
jgi:hypothetical protein